MPAGDSLGEFFVDATLRRTGLDQELSKLRGDLLGGFGLTDILAATVESDTSMRRMSSALKAIGGDVGKFDQLADALSRAFAVDDEDIKDMFTLAANLGATKEEIPEVVKAAMGLSEVLGTDMKSAIDDVMKAQNGNFQQLQRIIPALKNAATNEEKLAIVQKVVSQGLRQREAAAAGLGGSMEQIKVASEELKEAFGNLVALPVAQFFRDVADALRTLTPGTEESARAVMTLTQHYLRLIRTWRQFKGDQAGAAKAQAEIDELEQKVQDSMAKSVQRENEARNQGQKLQNKAVESMKEQRKEAEKLRNVIMSLDDLWREAQMDALGKGKGGASPFSFGAGEGNPLDIPEKRGGGAGASTRPVKVDVTKQEKVIEWLGKIYDVMKSGIPARFA